MALNALAFPADIQWRRLCVSADMLTRNVCGADFPPRWRSSVSVFIYEPPEDQQTYPNHTVAYLKVSCTITGVQPGAEVGKSHPDAVAAFNDVKVIEAFDSVVDQYYGCYGALLEVAVKPNVSDDQAEHIPLSTYPYFIDFEPKKREVIEVVTDTGERMSRSEAVVGVRKGTTTTDNHEVVDSDTWGISAGVSAGLNLGGMYSNTSTTKDMTGQQHENIRTADRGRELRETFSHQTQLAQMYHQFTGYHLGTNRAVFLMLPRPHILDREHTFVNGPRQLEGVQDVLLVMMRPKSVQAICVEAYLETAHLSFQKNVYEQRAETVEWPIHEVIIATQASREYKKEYSVPPGWELDTSREDGGFTISALGSTNPNAAAGSGILDTRIVESDDGKIVFGVTLAAIANQPIHGQATFEAGLVLMVHLRRIGDEPKDVPQDLYITGRGACCCQTVTTSMDPSSPPTVDEVPSGEGAAHAESFLAEAPVPPMAGVTSGHRSGMSVRAANRLRSYVGEWMVGTVNSPRRHPRGSLSFLDSQLVARRMADAVAAPDHADNTPVREVAGLDRDIAEAVASTEPWLRRADILRMSLAELRDRFDVSHEQSVALRRAALGLLAPARSRRWETADRPEVPDLIGLGADEARGALVAQQLRVGTVTETDNEQPRHTVLVQRPEAGVVARPGAPVDLVLASGLTVRVPDVIGRGIGEALRLLYDAGLLSEPELVFTDRPGARRHTVVGVEPRPRTHVTPRARVVLHVATGGEPR